VAVVADGRLVLEGEVSALRRRGDRRLRLAVTGGTGWTETLPPSTRVEEGTDGQVTVIVPPGSDPGEVIDAARSQGQLLTVQLEEPRLSELFRDALATRAVVRP
jgi:ABC-type uncharacterized transport system ATPase subunit